MGEFTKIEWADSTVNGMMGCDGCELSSNGGSGTCYAELMTRYRKGNSGWPTDFFVPKIFPGRLEKAMKWPDLTGTKRDGRPWFDGLPRHVFLDDLGDTFTESLPLDWIAPHVPAMAASPHTWIFLTKRPKRMAEFFSAYGSVPRNFLLGTSCIASTARAADLVKIKDARLWVSGEPLWAEMDFRRYLPYLELLVLGGESGRGTKPMPIERVRVPLGHALEAGVPVFVKQLGTYCEMSRADASNALGVGARFSLQCAALTARGVVRFVHSKGGDPSEWPADVVRREMPGEPPTMAHGCNER